MQWLTMMILKEYGIDAPLLAVDLSIKPRRQAAAARLIRAELLYPGCLELCIRF